MKSHLPVVACLAALPLLAAAEPGRPATITLEAGDHASGTGPFSVPLSPTEAEKLIGKAITLEADDSTVVAAQLIAGDSPRLTWLAETALAPGEKRAYRVETADPPEAEPRMRCVVSEATLSLMAGDRVILSYRKQPSALRDDFDPVYTRTGYIHPLLTPSGRSVTGDYPVDHPHQHALFQAWTKTRFEDRAINFWDQAKGKGVIRYLDTVDTVSGPVYAGFTVRQSHEDGTDPDRPRPVLEETWTVRAFALDGDRYLVDLESRQVCASPSPLVIEKYHYGGMAIRGPAAWFDPDKAATPPGSFLTSEGLVRENGNHSRPHWVSMHGSLDGQAAGVAVLSHPENFRAPQWVRLHPTKPYFVFTPQVEEGFRIEPGKPFIGRYRYLVYDGKPEDADLDGAWRNYASPPLTLTTDF